MDDGALYTAVGHRGMAILNPVGSAQLDEVVDLVGAAAGRGARAIDVGCGKAEFLVRLAERQGLRGVGVEPNPEFVAAARAAVARRAPGLVEILEGAAVAHPQEAGAYAVACVMGATHAYGGTAATLAALARMTTPGGHVVLGDGYWKHVPTDEELRAMGFAREECVALSELRENVARAGLEPVHVAVASDSDWDAYEERHLRNVGRYLREHPGDEQACRLWKRRKASRDAYLGVTRRVLGFALIVARKN